MTSTKAEKQTPSLSSRPGDTGRHRSAIPPPNWSEVLDSTGLPRAEYGALLSRIEGMPVAELRLLDQRLEATLRELGVTFESNKDRAPGDKPWFCDLLPQVFISEEWHRLARGLRQRLRAFECFLRDIYGKQEILRQDVLPIPPLLGSPVFQKPAVGLRPPTRAYLHLGAVCLKRNSEGALAVSSQHFGHANGLSAMIQNRRVLARVAPELFRDTPVASIAETPTAILEMLRETASELAGAPRHAAAEPMIVLLSPGPANDFYAEHGFLARRMGVPLVQGGDLLVLDDCVYLKTINGLERVHVIFNRVPDGMLDPLVLQRGSMLGVPGLVHCLRKGTVALVNALGSQLADDRALLPFSSQIIRFYLSEKPILPTVGTYWLGDLDQRELVIGNLSEYRILPLIGERLPGVVNNHGLSPNAAQEASLRQAIRRAPHLYVAQSIADQGAGTLCFEHGRRVERRQDHFVYALRVDDDFEVFPGALTRIAVEENLLPAAGLGGGSKDTWILHGDEAASDEPLHVHSRHRHRHELRPPARRVTSRSAESLYWLGRYLERAHHLAYLIQVIETLETEELNAAERKLYRPMWNKLLPHLDASPRRSISTARDRYRLVLEPGEPGAVVNVLRRSLNNADSIQDTLSPEAWSALGSLRATFARHHFFEKAPEEVCARVTRKLSELTTRSISQFYGSAESSMLEDDGWRFCRLGRELERAIITANATLACSAAFTYPGTLPSNGTGDGAKASALAPTSAVPQDNEIELSAFLRLLGTRDVYRRVYQMRAEPLPILQLLFQHPEAPRSLLHCLSKCAAELRASCPGDPAAVTRRPLASVEALCDRLQRIDWATFFESVEVDMLDAALPPAAAVHSPQAEIRAVLNATMKQHDVIADCFLNHQAQLSEPPQLFLEGFGHGI